ncbi:hypothetical protein PENSPDRAFT_686093 [Peniophora sp. CONT]|nr:hypothetical protein PENSPDRAFT_686093 [Peniophora sp. CONT]
MYTGSWSWSKAAHAHGVKADSFLVAQQERPSSLVPSPYQPVVVIQAGGEVEVSLQCGIGYPVVKVGLPLTLVGVFAELDAFPLRGTENVYPDLSPPLAAESGTMLSDKSAQREPERVTMTVFRKTRGRMSSAIPPDPNTHTRRVASLDQTFARTSSTVPLPIRTFARLQARTKPAHTTKQDITAWLSTSTPTDPVRIEEMSEDGAEGYEFSATRAPEDWPRSLSHLTHALLSSSTTSRVHFLRHDLLPLAQNGDLSLSQALS